MQQDTTKHTESVEKTLKGRPRVLTEEAEAMYRSIYGPTVKTRRGLQNKQYELRALRVLRDLNLPGLDYLFDVENDVVRHTVLNELGRMEDTSNMVSLARWLCEQRPSNKAAVEICRAERGVGRKPNALLTTCRILDILETASRKADDPERFMRAIAENVMDAIVYMEGGDA